MASNDPLKDILEELAMRSAATPKGEKLRKEIEARIAPFNASLTYQRQQQKPFITESSFRSDVAGWTNREAPFNEYVVNMPKGKMNDAELADTIAHEAIHQMRSTSGMRDRKMTGIMGDYTLGQLGHPETTTMMNLAKKLTGQKTYPIAADSGVGYNPEELLGYMAGIEGRQLKGTSITSLPEFKNMTQREKNFYFGETSGSSGGVWEGQIPQTIAEFLSKESGFGETKAAVKDKTKAIQDWLSENIGKVIGTR